MIKGATKKVTISPKNSSKILYYLKPGAIIEAYGGQTPKGYLHIIRPINGFVNIRGSSGKIMLEKIENDPNPPVSSDICPLSRLLRHSSIAMCGVYHYIIILLESIYIHIVLCEEVRFHNLRSSPFLYCFFCQAHLSTWSFVAFARRSST